MKQKDTRKIDKWILQFEFVNSLTPYDPGDDQSIMFNACVGSGPNLDVKAYEAWMEDDDDQSDGSRFTFGDRDIMVSLDLVDLLTVKEMKAILTHEMGHVLHGDDEVKADRHAVKKGYGKALSQALLKIYFASGRRPDMDTWQPEYKSSPASRIAALSQNKVRLPLDKGW